MISLHPHFRTNALTFPYNFSVTHQAYRIDFRLTDPVAQMRLLLPQRQEENIFSHSPLQEEVPVFLRRRKTRIGRHTNRKAVENAAMQTAFPNIGICTATAP